MTNAALAGAQSAATELLLLPPLVQNSAVLDGNSGDTGASANCSRIPREYLEVASAAGATALVDFLDGSDFHRRCPPISPELTQAMFYYGTDLRQQIWRSISAACLPIPGEVLENFAEARAEGLTELGVYRFVRFGQEQYWATGQRKTDVEGSTVRHLLGCWGRGNVRPDTIKLLYELQLAAEALVIVQKANQSKGSRLRRAFQVLFGSD
jgi:hypothetical protein